MANNTQISGLYWAPEANQFALVAPDFPAREYGFTRHPVQLTHWFSEDLYGVLRAYLDDHFKYVSPAAMERLKAHIDAYAASYATMPPEGIAPEMPCPPGLAYREFQRAGIYHAWLATQGASLENRKGCLIADEMGLGKTIQAIGFANCIRAARVLVVCPASLRINWEREIKKWAVHRTDVHHVTSVTSYKPAGWHIVSYDMAKRHDLRARLMLDRFDLLVVDEAHYVKTPRAARTTTVVGCCGRAAMEGLLNRAARTVFLTGTPVPNRPVESWSMVWPFILDRFPVSTKNQFDRMFGIWVRTPFGLKYAGAKNVPDMNVRLRAGFMIRRLKSQVLHELLPLQHKMVVFPSGGGAFREILNEEKQFDVAEIIKHAVPRGSALAQLRQRMGVAKIPLVVSYIKDMLEEVEKVVVFAWHTEVVEGLMQALEMYGAVKITGSCTLRSRQAATDAFQGNPSCRVLIGNIEAAGVGWTLTAAQDVVFAEHSWVPSQNVQAGGRCHRIGQRGSVTLHDLVVEGSLDGKVLLAGAKKTQEIEEMLS